MRITRVALSFFSIGFLAGSFEQAAGLGYARQDPAPAVAEDLARPAPPLVIASVTSPLETGLEASPDAKAGAGNPLAAGDASAAEWIFGSSKPQPTMASPSQGLAEAPPEPRPPSPLPEFILPFEAGRVTSLYNQGRRHPAIDLAGPLGTPVYATTRKQRVTFAGWRGGYGNLVITTDPQGRQHYYGHLSRILVRPGTVLEQGGTLGLLGSTGRSTGPHVHYEVRTARGRHLDPSRLLFAGLTVRRGYAWHMPRPQAGQPRFAERADRASRSGKAGR